MTVISNRVSANAMEPVLELPSIRRSIATSSLLSNVVLR
jgi:hypothetical protein